MVVGHLVSCLGPGPAIRDISASSPGYLPGCVSEPSGVTVFLPPDPNPAHQVRLAALPSKGIVPLFGPFPRPLMGPRPLAVVRTLEEGMQVVALRQHCIPGLDRAAAPTLRLSAGATVLPGWDLV